MCWTIFKDAIECLSQLATIVGIGIAYYGWKKQMLWQNNYNLAKEILTIIYKVVDNIEKIRFPMMFPHEMSEVRTQTDSPTSDDKIYWQAIGNRFKKSDNLINELRLIKQLSNIHLTSEIVELINQFLDHYKILAIVFKNEQNNYYNRPTIQTSKHNLINLARNYNAYATKDEDDVYFKELAEIIEKLETHLRPYLIHQSFPFLLNILNKK
jgi:hypothetical protein